jgi:hypothetical protein
MAYVEPRPEVLVGGALPVADPTDGSVVGRPGPFGRDRVVSALPLMGGPAVLSAAATLVDAHGRFVADPDGDLVGTAAIVIGRLLSAGVVSDTRGL